MIGGWLREREKNYDFLWVNDLFFYNSLRGWRNENGRYYYYSDELSFFFSFRFLFLPFSFLHLFASLGYFGLDIIIGDGTLNPFFLLLFRVLVLFLGSFYLTHYPSPILSRARSAERCDGTRGRDLVHVMRRWRERLEAVKCGDTRRRQDREIERGGYMAAAEGKKAKESTRKEKGEAEKIKQTGAIFQIPNTLIYLFISLNHTESNPYSYSLFSIHPFLFPLSLQRYYSSSSLVFFFYLCQ